MLATRSTFTGRRHFRQFRLQPRSSRRIALRFRRYGRQRGRRIISSLSRLRPRSRRQLPSRQSRELDEIEMRIGRDGITGRILTRRSGDCYCRSYRAVGLTEERSPRADVVESVGETTTKFKPQPSFPPLPYDGNESIHPCQHPTTRASSDERTSSRNSSQYPRFSPQHYPSSIIIWTSRKDSTLFPSLLVPCGRAGATSIRTAGLE